VEVHFHQKIRDELRFQSLEELKDQIVKDVAETKKIFAETKKL
jgi:riboflavin kinase/FMN adenylyltransferase